MFFWFSGESFSIIDALTKLILVLTGSILIICFCHKLTNYKKSRRYKYSFARAQQSDQHHLDVSPMIAWHSQPTAAAVSQTVVNSGGNLVHQSCGQTSQQTTNNRGAQESLSSFSSISYDPYNTIRPLFGNQLSGLETQHAYLGSAGPTFQAPLASEAYGYHSASSVAHSAGPTQSAFQRPEGTLSVGSASGGRNCFVPNLDARNGAIFLANPSLQLGQQSYDNQHSPEAQLDGASPLHEDSCPSYEEAIAQTGGPPATGQTVAKSEPLGEPQNGPQAEPEAAEIEENDEQNGSTS